MLKKLLIFIVLLVPITSLAAGASKAKKEEPVVHLTDEQIYEQLKKLALVFETARDSFVEEADEKKNAGICDERHVSGVGSAFIVSVGR